MRRILTMAFALTTLAFAGAANATEKGVVGGAVAGGVGGAVVAGPPGAVVGAIGGALIGNHVTNHRHWSHRRYVRHHRHH